MTTLFINMRLAFIAQRTFVNNIKWFHDWGTSMGQKYVNFGTEYNHMKMLFLDWYYTTLYFRYPFNISINLVNVRKWLCDKSLQWRHNGRDGVSNHQRIACLLNRLFRCRSKKTSKLCRWIPLTKSQQRGKMFPFDDVIMYKKAVHAARVIVSWPKSWQRLTLDTSDLIMVMMMMMIMTATLMMRTILSWGSSKGEWVSC